MNNHVLPATIIFLVCISVRGLPTYDYVVIQKGPIAPQICTSNILLLYIHIHFYIIVHNKYTSVNCNDILHCQVDIYCIIVYMNCILTQEKKEEIWLSPMTKAPTPTEMSKGQSDNTNNATKKFD